MATTIRINEDIKQQLKLKSAQTAVAIYRSKFLALRRVSKL